MRVGSVCSGIECASVAWASLEGWTPQWFAEVESAACAVLAHRFPDVPNHGDMTRIPDDASDIDLLVGGTPCTSFSRAGLRGGLDDDRGNLALEFCRLAQRFEPRWVVWENVVDVLSSVSHSAADPSPPPPPVDMELDGQEVETEEDYDAEELHAFQCFLAALEECGYHCAWRVLDAQYVRVDGFPGAVPQRRRRLFVVGYLGGPASRAAAVLFEPDGMRGHSPPRREAGAQVAGTLTASLGRRCGVPDGGDTRGQLIPTVAGTLLNNGKAAGSATTQDAFSGLLIPAVARTLTTREGQRGDPEVATLLPMPFSPEQVTSSHNRSNPQPGDPCPTLTGSSGQPPAVAFQHQASMAQSMNPGPISPTLGVTKTPAVFGGAGVRRLMPIETERLMGLPDGWTEVPYRGGIMKDGPRYRLTGNGMATNVMRWLGMRLAMVDAMTTNATPHTARLPTRRQAAHLAPSVPSDALTGEFEHTNSTTRT